MKFAHYTVFGMAAFLALTVSVIVTSGTDNTADGPKMRKALDAPAPDAEPSTGTSIRHGRVDI